MNKELKDRIRPRVDLRGVDLRGADLSWANLSEANLNEADLSWANLRKADLRGVNLRGADLSWANLRGADLSWANLSWVNLRQTEGIHDTIIVAGVRSDGWQFLLTRTMPKEWRVVAGCRNYTISEAREHWTNTRGGSPLEDESQALIDHALRIAKIRNWPTDA